MTEGMNGERVMRRKDSKNAGCYGMNGVGALVLRGDEREGGGIRHKRMKKLKIRDDVVPSSGGRGRGTRARQVRWLRTTAAGSRCCCKNVKGRGMAVRGRQHWRRRSRRASRTTFSGGPCHCAGRVHSGLILHILCVAVAWCWWLVCLKNMAALVLTKILLSASSSRAFYTTCRSRPILYRAEHHFLMGEVLWPYALEPSRGLCGSGTPLHQPPLPSPSFLPPFIEQSKPMQAL